MFSVKGFAILTFDVDLIRDSPPLIKSELNWPLGDPHPLDFTRDPQSGVVTGERWGMFY